MDEVTLLCDEHVAGKNKLEMLKKIGRKATMTDFAVLLGGYYNSYIRTGRYWIKHVINNSDYISYKYTNNRENGIRPVVSYSKIKDDISNETINENGILEIEYDEYPQYTVSKELQEKLEELYKNNNLTKTGKKYTTDSRKYYEFSKDFLPQEHIEYEFDDKKYVRVKANSYYDGSLFHLSNGEKYIDDDYVWVEVSKVKWLVDEENDIALSKNILVAGIQYDNKEEYTGAFENSNMYKYLNTYFIKDIQIKEKYIDITKLSGTYGEAMALIEEAKRRHNAILDKSIIGKTLIKHL